MQEVRTSAAVQLALQEMGVDFQPGWAGGTGIVANIGTGTPIVALRADMDALPIQEDGDLEFKSQVRLLSNSSALWVADPRAGGLRR